MNTTSLVQSPKDISAVVVTKGGYDISKALEPLSVFKEVIVWDNSIETDLKVYGRYAAIDRASSDTIYVQDDDIVMHDIPAFVAKYTHANLVLCNMPEAFQRAYTPIGMGLVGFGAIFNRSLLRYLDMYKGPRDELFLTECDRVFTFVNGLDVVEHPFSHLPYAHDTSRMWRRPNHENALREIRTRLLSTLYFRSE